MRNRIFLFFFLVLITNKATSQYRIVPSHSDDEDRLISLNRDINTAFRNTNASSDYIGSLRLIESDNSQPEFSKVNFPYFYWQYPEYSKNNRLNITQRKFVKKIGENHFWTNPNRFFSWESKSREDYFVINPILDLAYSPKIGKIDTFISNGRGVEIYGQMGEKLSFYTSVMDYQMSYPTFFDDYIVQNGVVPGVGNTQANKSKLTEFYYSTGYMNILLLQKKIKAKEKHHLDTTIYKIDFSIGHDKQFVGNGFRSLLLSNFAPPSFYAQINYKLGPFSYQNLFKQLVRDMSRDTNKMLNRKYLAMHRGEIAFFKNKFNLGFSEMIVFSRPNNAFDITYLNPIIFYRSIERDLGSSDNALIGLDFSYKLKALKFYGQLIIDEFRFSAITTDRNSYLNKNGYQLGVYWFPKFKSIKQNYIQLEFNSVRPYTYSHWSSNYYSHYNQPLAHPLESNFRELVLRSFWIPKINTRFSIKNTLIIANRGINSNNENVGSDFRLNYYTASNRKDANMLSGKLRNIVSSSITFRYFLLPNCTIEFTHILRIENDDIQNYAMIGLKFNFNQSRDIFQF